MIRGSDSAARVVKLVDTGDLKSLYKGINTLQKHIVRDNNKIYVANQDFASVVELVYTSDLKSDGLTAMRVQVPPLAPT